jgi:NAD(P)H dehydrogenase (quinone)
MNVFIVLAHAEPQSFNGAMFRNAVEVLQRGGHDIRTSDLHAAGFNPVSDRRNFTSLKDPQFFKQQIEEMRATPEQRAIWLKNYEARLGSIAQEKPIDVGEY